MILSKLREGNYKAFSRQDAAKAKANIDAIKYVEFLGTQTKTPIDLWDVKELFGDGVGYNFIKDKKEINKRFFSELEKRRALPTLVTDEMRNEILRLTGMRGTGQVDQIRRDIATQEMQIDQACTRIIGYRRTLFDLQRRLDAMRNASDPVLAEEFCKVIERGFWKLEGIRDGHIFLSTVPEVVLTLKNPAANVNISVNMGRYCASVNIVRMYATLHPWENNHLTFNNYHPYVQSNGRICFGDRQLQAENFLNRAKMDDFFNLLASLVTTYTEGTVAYRALESFNIAITDKGSDEAEGYKFRPLPFKRADDLHENERPFFVFAQSVGKYGEPIDAPEDTPETEEEEESDPNF